MSDVMHYLPTRVPHGPRKDSEPDLVPPESRITHGDREVLWLGVAEDRSVRLCGTQPDPSDFACPFCGAGQSQPCQTPEHELAWGQFHRRRVDMALGAQAWLTAVGIEQW